MNASEKTKKIKVLAVDDEKAVLQLYNTFLKFRGYTVTAVASAEACLAHLTQNVPDILLLDINMPGIDGLKLLEIIRTTESGRLLPVVMISARGEEDVIKEAVRLGCDNFLVKPFRLQDLADRISDELFSLDIEDIRAILKMPTVPQNGILRIPEMRIKEVRLWDAHPIRWQERELCVLVQRGARPSILAKLPEDELADKIRIFRKHLMKWRRLWPGP